MQWKAEDLSLHFIIGFVRPTLTSEASVADQVLVFERLLKFIVFLNKCCDLALSNRCESIFTEGSHRHIGNV